MEKIRTDLAAELYGEAEKAYASENKGKPDGIIVGGFFLLPDYRKISKRNGV